MNRDDIRAAFASKCKTRRKLHTITLNEDGTTIAVAIRGMTVGQRKKVMDAATVMQHDEDGKAVSVQDGTTLALHTAIACTMVPDTDEPVFDERDLEILKTLPFGVVDELANIVAELSGGNKTQAESLGNSGATPSDASSLGSPAN